MQKNVVLFWRQEDKAKVILKYYAIPISVSDPLRDTASGIRLGNVAQPPAAFNAIIGLERRWMDEYSKQIRRSLLWNSYSFWEGPCFWRGVGGGRCEAVQLYIHLLCQPQLRIWRLSLFLLQRRIKWNQGQMEDPINHQWNRIFSNIFLRSRQESAAAVHICQLTSAKEFFEHLYMINDLLGLDISAF